MKNLRWRGIMPASDREGREIVMLFVQGKGKSRKLVAPKSVGDYHERIRLISKATEPEDRVFTTVNGKPAKSLYTSLLADLLDKANLREGTHGVARCTDCFRHTYATLRLQEGVDSMKVVRAYVQVGSLQQLDGLGLHMDHAICVLQRPEYF